MKVSPPLPPQPLLALFHGGLGKGAKKIANVSGVRSAAREKKIFPLPIYNISAKRTPTQLPHQSGGTLEIFGAVPSAELIMMTAGLFFRFDGQLL